MTLRIVRLGTPRHRDEGVRIGTVRRPPRGVPKAEFASRDYYDTWLPQLSPSAELVGQALDAVAHDDEREWKRFTTQFRREMREPDASHLLDLLATLSKHSDFSIGCYCEREERCHRSVLRELLHERGARIAED